jgi:hypothetical protein
MRMRHLFVALLVAATGVVAVQGTASSHEDRKSRHESDRHDRGRHDRSSHDRDRHDRGGHDRDKDDWSPITRQDFTLTSDLSEENGTVVASGAINATGEDVSVSDTENQFVFPDGTLTVFHASERSKEHFDEEDCTGSFRETGRYVISGGTGLYEGVTGSGEYRVKGRFENGCEGQTPTGTITIKARGSINFPTE